MANCETVQHTVWSKEAIISANEGKRVMTGPQSHWWGWWMAFSSSTWQFITHLRHKHVPTLTMLFHTQEITRSPMHCSFFPLFIFCMSTCAVLLQPFSIVWLTLNSHGQPWRTLMYTHTQTNIASPLPYHTISLVKDRKHCGTVFPCHLCLSLQ